MYARAVYTCVNENKKKQETITWKQFLLWVPNFSFLKMYIFFNFVNPTLFALLFLIATTIMLSYCICICVRDVATAASDYLHFESHRNAKRLHVCGAGAEVNVSRSFATAGGWGYYDDDSANTVLHLTPRYRVRIQIDD